jgi:UDP-N-acetylglucosamine--N-acetylmuramyl-(pentapeptide) pyrophosphoryl-undecaprenol N-acetylglucosamine transferase
MAAIYGSADLLITRSGAMTCAELMTMGRSAILVPLAHGNGEQIENADQLAKMGLAKSVPNERFDAQWLAANLNSALADVRLGSSKQSSIHLGAARRLAQLALEEVA